MGTNRELAALRLFEEKSVKLVELGFTQSLMHQESGFRMNWDRDAGAASTRYGPSEESIEAFVLTLRFFIQDNEPCSLRKMTGHFDALRAAGMISDETHRLWHEARYEVNAYLDSPTCFTDAWKGKDGNEVRRVNYSHRDIMEIFVYGGLAHSSVEKTPIFKRWQSNPLVFPFMENLFVTVIGKLVFAFESMRQEIVEPAIHQIEEAAV